MTETSNIARVIKGRGTPPDLEAGDIVFDYTGKIWTNDENGQKIIVADLSTTVDIVDDLTSNDSTKALSAKQGKVLNDTKASIDQLNAVNDRIDQIADVHITTASFDNSNNTLTITSSDGSTKEVVIPDDKVLLVNDLVTDDSTKALTAKQGKILNDTKASISYVDNGLSSKIDEVSGYGLISNSDLDKLHGIATGAEVNVQSDWNATSGDAFIKNKPVISTTVPTSNASDSRLVTEKAVSDAINAHTMKLWTY